MIEFPVRPSFSFFSSSSCPLTSLLIKPARKTPTCVITGLPALYRDPRTQAPYASIAAYKTLTSVISHSYSWSETVGAFTGQIGLGLELDFEKTSNGRKVPGLSSGSLVAAAFVNGAGGLNGTSSIAVGRTTLASFNNGTSNNFGSTSNSNSNLNLGMGGSNMFNTKGKGKEKQSSSTNKKEKEIVPILPIEPSNPYGLTWNGEGKEGREARARGRESLDAATSSSNNSTPKLENFVTTTTSTNGIVGGGEEMVKKARGRSRSRSKSLAIVAVENGTDLNGDIEMK